VHVDGIRRVAQRDVERHEEIVQRCWLMAIPA
jgi:hypothetical protein